jgi:hypothetical protein
MKPWYQSKTVWAAVVAVVATVLGTVYKWNIGEAEQAQLVDAIMVVVDIIAGAVVVIGRTNAQGPLGS